MCNIKAGLRVAETPLKERVPLSHSSGWDSCTKYLNRKQHWMHRCTFPSSPWWPQRCTSDTHLSCEVLSDSLETLLLPWSQYRRVTSPQTKAILKEAKSNLLGLQSSRFPLKAYRDAISYITNHNWRQVVQCEYCIMFSHVYLRLLFPMHHGTMFVRD